MLKGKIPTLALSVILMGISMGGLILFNVMLAPKTIEVFTAGDTLFPGDYLSETNTELRSMEAGKLDMYLTVDNVDQFGSYPLIEMVYPGEMIPLSSLADPAGIRQPERIASLLADPEQVAVVVPVSGETAPEGIVPGDHVDLIVSIGAGNFLAGSFESAASQETELYQLDQEDVYKLFGPLEGAEEWLDDGGEHISLPVTKAIVTGARVLQVQFDWTTQPSFDPDQGAKRLRGSILALVVEVPRINAEAVAFAVHNGEVRISVVYPNLSYWEINTPGTVWEDLIQFTREERGVWVESLLDLAIQQAGGAAAIKRATEQEEWLENLQLPLIEEKE